MKGMIIKNYDRESAVQYAKIWAFNRNPKFYNFDNLGGDCTNFVSQCLLSGCKVMNYTQNFGWYYHSINDRTPSWTGVEFLYNFLTSNKSVGPFAKLVDRFSTKIGDVIELGRQNGSFYHSMIITKIQNGNIYTSSHTVDSFDRPLSSYIYDKIRFIHILGVRI